MRRRRRRRLSGDVFGPYRIGLALVQLIGLLILWFNPFEALLPGIIKIFYMSLH